MVPLTVVSTYTVKNFRFSNDFFANRAYLAWSRTGMRNNSTAANVRGQSNLNSIIAWAAMRSSGHIAAPTIQDDF